MQKKNKSNFLKKIFLIFIITLSLVFPFSFIPTTNVKAQETDSLLGTWIWNDILTTPDFLPLDEIITYDIDISVKILFPEGFSYLFILYNLDEILASSESEVIQNNIEYVSGGTDNYIEAVANNLNLVNGSNRFLFYPSDSRRLNLPTGNLNGFYPTNAPITTGTLTLRISGIDIVFTFSDYIAYMCLGASEMYNSIDDSWQSIFSTTECKTMTFTGGTDINNADFVSWVQANATKQEEEEPEEPTPIPDIASGDYRVNYNYSWPLTEIVEFTGSLTYNNISYSSLFMGPGVIYLLSDGTTAIQKNIMNNYQWLVDSFTFTSIDGLFNTNDIHNAVESFDSQVNGVLNENFGLSLGSTHYTFNPIIDYNILGYVEFDMPFRTGDEFDLLYDYMYYSTTLDTLYYGGREEVNIVYQNGVWTSDIYKNFMCENLITNYAVGNFLAQNLDIYQLNDNFYIKGYYYFNDSIRVSDLLDLNFLSDFSYIYNGIIYNSFLPTYNVITSNGVVTSYTIVLDFYNTNTTKRTTLLSGQYTDPSAFISTNNNSRQIYISPTMVNYDTYEWLNENGLFIYYSDAEHTELGDLFLVFPDVIIHFFASLLTFDLFGIDVFTAICSILTVLLAIWLIRKLL